MTVFSIQKVYLIFNTKKIFCHIFGNWNILKAKPVVFEKTFLF